MRKNLLMLVVTLLTTVMANAETTQSACATLNHEGTVTIFMGGNGLKEAHDAAVDGDAIVLSPGTFNAVTFPKLSPCAVLVQHFLPFPVTPSNPKLRLTSMVMFILILLHLKASLPLKVATLTMRFISIKLLKPMCLKLALLRFQR